MRIELMLYVSGGGVAEVVRNQLIRRAVAGDKPFLPRALPRHWDLNKYRPPLD